MSLTVLIGGARSGKSALAVDIGRRFDEKHDDTTVTFIATAPRSDDDMDARIDRHMAERPGHWVTVEEQIDLVGAIGRATPGLVIIDCLTLWTSNLMWADQTDEEVHERTARAVQAAIDHSGDVVVVTNEVGLGIVPDNKLARRYRDLHGRVNQQFVAGAERSLHLVAGRATPLVDPWTLLSGLL
jgi:adenosylcobinamide kinase/adenosylcobinamide-phosphate guanylyltransferase